MELHTTAEVISFAKKLEGDSAEFYESVSQKYTKDKDTFLAFVQENKNYVVQIERAYYGVISDAIEGCFAFEINPDNYIFETVPIDKASEVLNKAVNIEQKMVKFYTDAARQSKSLMADVPATFNLIAKKRTNRIMKLKSLL